MWFKIGAAVILLGASLGSLAKGVGTDGGQEYFNCLIFALTFIPFSYQYVLSEQFLKDSGRSVWELEVATYWGELVFMVMLAPFQSLLLRLLGEQPASFNLESGLATLLGESINLSVRDPKPLLLFLATCCASMFNDLSYLALMKYASASLMTVSMGFSVPIVNVIMSLSFLGVNMEPFNRWNIVSCVVCFVGLSIWAKGEAEDEANETAKVEGG